MLDNCKTACERWGGVSEIIDRWLQERQSLLVLFLKLTAPKEELSSQDHQETLRNFCQILVDYVSAGHFEIYQQLIDESQALNDHEALEKAKKPYQLIDSTTESVLDFNDKYQETDDLEALSSDLSALGQTLEVRFESEDLMIEVLHNSHKDQLTEQHS